jgi:hypothetical protein
MHQGDPDDATRVRRSREHPNPVDDSKYDYRCDGAIPRSGQTRHDHPARGPGAAVKAEIGDREFSAYITEAVARRYQLDLLAKLLDEMD